MNNQELYSVMVQTNCTLKTRASTNMQIEWRPKKAGKWQPFQRKRASERCLPL